MKVQGTFYSFYYFAHIMGLFHLNEQSETNSNIIKNDEQVNVQPKHSRIEHSIIILYECSIHVTGRTFVHHLVRTLFNNFKMLDGVLKY